MVSAEQASPGRLLGARRVARDEAATWVSFLGAANGVYHPKVFFDQGMLRWVFLTKVLFRKYASLGIPHEEIIRYFIRAQEILTPGARIVLKLPWRISIQSALKQHSVNTQQNTHAIQTAHNRRQHHNNKPTLKTALKDTSR